MGIVIGNRIGCLQIDAISPKIREQVFLYEGMGGIPVWIYRPFNQGNAISRCGRKPEEIIKKLAEELPNCKFVFGASKLEQLVWIERL